MTAEFLIRDDFQSYSLSNLTPLLKAQATDLTSVGNCYSRKQLSLEVLA